MCLFTGAALSVSGTYRTHAHSSHEPRRRLSRQRWSSPRCPHIAQEGIWLLALQPGVEAKHMLEHMTRRPIVFLVMLFLISPEIAEHYGKALLRLIIHRECVSW